MIVPLVDLDEPLSLALAWRVRHRQNRLAHITVARITHHPDDLKTRWPPIHEEVPSNHFPIGFSPLKYCFANASLTIAAPGEKSLDRKSLPAIKGIFIVPIHPGETFRNHAGTSVGSEPLMESALVLKPHPSSNGQSAYEGAQEVLSQYKRQAVLLVLAKLSAALRIWFRPDYQRNNELARDVFRNARRAEA